MADSSRKVTDLTVEEVMGIKTDVLQSLVDKLDLMIEKKLETYGLDNPKESRQNQDYVTELRTNRRALKRGFVEYIGGIAASGLVASIVTFIGTHTR